MSEPDLRKGVNGNHTPIVEDPDSDRSRPNSAYYDDPPEEEIIDISRDEAASHRAENSSNRQTPRPSEDDSRSRSPAYVAPIPKIGKIPPVKRSSGSSSGRPQFPRYLTSSLVGKKIDEYGDVVDDNGNVLGRVAGDLPSMVGRTVLNQRGDVLGDDGELLGYVAEVESEKQRQREREEQEAAKPAAEQQEQQPPKTQRLDEFMGRNMSAFHIDHEGNILDAKGNLVGSFHDFKKMGPKPIGKMPEHDEDEEEGDETKASGSSGTQSKPPAQEEARPNAQSYRKEGVSPSDIFLDVKSTREGIQLTIRIPTVFPDGGQPQVRFS